MTQPQSVCSIVNERPQQIIAFRDAQIETLFKKLGSRRLLDDYLAPALSGQNGRNSLVLNIDSYPFHPACSRAGTQGSGAYPPVVILFEKVL